MKIELFSDMVCPFCYIGKRRLDRALARFPYRDKVEVVYRAFQLDPEASPDGHETLPERERRVRGIPLEVIRGRLEMVTELAASEGLVYDLTRALPVNTFDAHRLMHFAAGTPHLDAVAENILRAYAVEGRSIADHEVLADLAAKAGLDLEPTRAMLASDAHADDVRSDVARAHALGIRTVPSFVVDESVGFSGVDSTGTLLTLLERAWRDSKRG